MWIWLREYVYTLLNLKGFGFVAHVCEFFARFARMHDA